MDLLMSPVVERLSSPFAGSEFPANTVAHPPNQPAQPGQPGQPRERPKPQSALEIARFLLEARDTEAMATRAVTAIGLLPGVAWARLCHHSEPTPQRLTVALPGRERELAVQLSPPLALGTVQEIRTLLTLVQSIHARLSDIESLRNDARTDALTGLWNRRGFMPFLDQAIARTGRSGASITLMLCDIDHFKTINDTQGHEAGDRVLRLVAECMVMSVRPSDLVARLGGDELAVLLADSDADGGLGVAQRLREALGLSDGPNPTLSIGLADSRAVDRTLDRKIQREQLLRAADEALYAAKAAGRDRSVIHERCVPPSVVPEPVSASSDSTFALFHDR